MGGLIGCCKPTEDLNTSSTRRSIPASSVASPNLRTPDKSFTLTRFDKFSELVGSKCAGVVSHLFTSSDKLRVKLTFKPKTCASCRKPQRYSAAELKCKHILCTPCARNCIMQHEGEDRRLPCPTCSRPSRITVLAQKLQQPTGSMSYSSSSAHSQHSQTYQFLCKICCDMYSIDQAVTLNCDHRLCRDCMMNYLELVVNSMNFGLEDLKCPVFECKDAVDIHIIKAMLSDKMFKLYDSVRAKMVDFGDGTALR
mmetsp:Transcript_19575/g.35910  ORF Transcript_19575/g.35910 Transcript_19575/m.35910 type:complete len:254 (-) Transcript_19575:432-1193(-)